MRALLLLLNVEIAGGFIIRLPGGPQHSWAVRSSFDPIDAFASLEGIDQEDAAIAVGTESGAQTTLRPRHLFRTQFDRLAGTLRSSRDAKEVSWAIQELCQLPALLGGAPGTHLDHSAFTLMLDACRRADPPLGQEKVRGVLAAMKGQGLEPNIKTFEAAIGALVAARDVIGAAAAYREAIVYPALIMPSGRQE